MCVRASQAVLVVKNLPVNVGDIRDVGSIPRSGRSPGKGNGSPLQYSCLENPRDRGAWRATVYSVTKSWTWLKWLSTHICIYVWGGGQQHCSIGCAFWFFMLDVQANFGNAIHSLDGSFLKIKNFLIWFRRYFKNLTMSTNDYYDSRAIPQW